MTSSQRKTAFALRLNVEAFVKVVGLEDVGFLTLTFADHVCDWREGQRRFNSFMTDYGREKFGRYICVMEPQQSGRVHYHLLVDCGYDIRTGLNFDEIKRGDYRSAKSELRWLWKELRAVLPRYGFGRHELLPIRTGVHGISKYVAKYISKGALHRDRRFKGSRWVRYSRGWRFAVSKFSWASPGARCYRMKLAELASRMGLQYEDMKEQFGPKWAFALNDILRAMVPQEYPDIWHALADGFTVKDFLGAPHSLWEGTNIRLGRASRRLKLIDAVRLAKHLREVTSLS